MRLIATTSARGLDVLEIALVSSFGSGGEKFGLHWGARKGEIRQISYQFGVDPKKQLLPLFFLLAGPEGGMVIEGETEGGLEQFETVLEIAELTAEAIQLVSRAFGGAVATRLRQAENAAAATEG